MINHSKSIDSSNDTKADGMKLENNSAPPILSYHAGNLLKEPGSDHGGRLSIRGLC